METKDTAEATLEAMAARLGMRVCKIPTWSAEDRVKYRDQHGKRSHYGYERHDDIEIAAATRMLMRDELNHEALVCAARDRICALSSERDAALSVQKQLVEALEIAEAYVLDKVNEDGGIDECDIGLRVDLEKARAAILAAKASS